MSTFHPAVYGALYLALREQEECKASAETAGNIYDTSVQAAYYDAAIAGLQEAIALLHSGDADARLGDLLIVEAGVLGPMHCIIHDTPPIPRNSKCPKCDPRAAQIADARRMLDFLEANPELPMRNVGIQAHTDGTDDEGREQVDAAAEILGTAPTTSPFGQHYQVEKTFGRAAYEVVLVPKAAMQRHHAVLTAGNAAVDAAHAAEVPAAAEADDVDVRALHTAHLSDGVMICGHCLGLWPCLAINAQDVAEDFGATPSTTEPEEDRHEP